MNITYKILLFKSGALGDVLLTTPLIRAIKQVFPTSQITYATSEWAAPAIRNNPYLSNTMIFKNDLVYGKDYIGLLSLRSKIKKEKFDIAFILDKSSKASFFMKSCGIPMRIGFKRGIEKNNNTHNIIYGPVFHETDYYLSLLSVFSKVKFDSKLDFFTSSSAKAKAQDFLVKNNIYKPIICVVPGGARNPGVGDDVIRRWPLRNYFELCKQLVDSGNVVLLLGSPDEVANNRKISLSFLEDVYDLTGQLSLEETGAFMQISSAVVCNDSGPMHVASATNEKVIAIFGPSSPYRKAPRHPKSDWLWCNDHYDESYEVVGLQSKHYNNYDIDQIMVDDVYKLIKEVLWR